MISKAKAKGLPGRPLSPATPLATLLPIMGAGNSNRIYRAEEAPASTETQTAPLLTQPPAQPAALFSQFMPIIAPLSPSPENPDVDPPSPELPAAFGVVLPAPPADLFHALAGTPQAPLSQPVPDLSEFHRHLSEPLVLRALASEPQQRLYEVAFQTGPERLDLNQDTVITSQDAQVLYYFALLQEGTIDQATLTTLLNNLSGTTLSTDALIALNLLGPIALDSPRAIPDLDLNLDGSIDLQDVRVLYYAYRFGDILRASPSLRETLLSDLTVQDDVADADRQEVYLDMLAQAASLRPPVPAGDHVFQVDEGTSYILSTDDLSARDPDDAGAVLTWTVTTDPTDGRLQLDPGGGASVVVISTAGEDTTFTQADVDAGRVVYVHVSGDTEDSFEVQVANLNDPGPSGAVTLTVEVVESTNQPPTAVTLTNRVITLREDADTPITVAGIDLTDLDGNDVLELTGDDADLFEFNPGQTELLLRDGVDLDFETNPVLNVRVRVVRDPAGASADLSIAVEDVPEAPTTGGGLAFTVAEGASHMLMTTDLSAMDEDVSDGPDMLTWRVTTAPTNGQLELTTNPGTSISTFTQADVDAERVLYVHNGGETTEDGFTVQVEDDGGLPAADPVMLTVTVTPVNDAPTATSDPFEVAVGASYRLTTDDLSATDEDDGPAELTWMVTGVPGNGRLAFLDTPEAAITSFTQADVDAGRVVYIHTGTDTTPDSFTVRVMDDDGEMAAPVTLTVAVVNTPMDMLPTAVTLTNQVPELAENADTSSTMRVADIAVTDNEGGEMLELTGDDAGLFEFNGDQTQLLLSADAALDFETNPFLDVTVRAVRNPAGVNAALRIPVTDQNDAPTTSGGLAFTVTEGASYTLMTTDLSAMDEDGSDGPAQLTWRVVAGNGPANGQLELMSDRGTPINEFTQDDVNMGRVFYVHNGGETTMDSFTVEVMDDGGLPAAAPVTLDVTVTPMNEAPTTTGSGTLTVDEGASQRLTTAELSATDEEDGPDALIWTLTTAPMNGQLELRPIGGGSVMAITQDMTFTQVQLAAGEVFYVHDGGETTMDSFTVQVMDDDGETAAPVTLDVNVMSMDDAPTAVMLINPIDSLDENADTSDRTKVADIMVTDADSSSLADLELAGTHMDLFELGTDSITGNLELFLIADAVLDHEDTSTLEVTVQVVRDTSVSATLSFPVNDVNEAPTTTSRTDPFTVAEGASYMLMTTDLSAMDMDESDDLTDLTWTLTTAPMNGQLELRPIGGGSVMAITQDMTFTQVQLAAGEVFYVHDGGEIDTDSFTVQVMDDDGEMADPVTLTVNVTAMDDTPTGVALTRTVNSLDENADTSDRTKVADIMVTDADSSSLADLELAGTHMDLFELGTDSITGNLELFLIADAVLDHEDTSTLEVTVQVVRDTSVSATLSFPVNDVNEAPTTTSRIDPFTVAEGASYMLMTTDLSAMDMDESDDPTDLTWTLTTAPMNGQLELRSAGEAPVVITIGGQTFTQDDVNNNRVFYVHNGGEIDTDSFTVQVMDDDGEMADPVTLDVTVTAVNDAPTASSGDPIMVDEGAERMLTMADLFAMDRDESDGPTELTWTLTTAPMNGQLELRSAGEAPVVITIGGQTFTQDDVNMDRVFYVHDGGEIDTDSFTVQVMDDDGEMAAPVTLTVNVMPVNDAPTASSGDPIMVDEGAESMLMMVNLFAMDMDESDGPTELTWTLTTDPTNGRLELRSAGEAPVVIMPRGQTFTQDDVNNDRVFYVHDGGELSTDSFTLQVMDDEGTPAAAPVTLTVNVMPVNDAPTASSGDPIMVDEGAESMLMMVNLFAMDMDESDGPTELTWTLTTDPTNGRLELRSAGEAPVVIMPRGQTFTQDDVNNDRVFYVHDGGELSTDSFTLQVMDDEGTPAAAPVTLTVNVMPVNDAPTASSGDPIMVDEGAESMLMMANLFAMDMDESDGPTELTWTLTTAPTNGRLELRPGGVAPVVTITAAGMETFTQDDVNNDRVFYVHDGGELSTDSFTLQVMDDEGTPAAAPVTLTVNVMPVNDAPTASSGDPIMVDEGAESMLMMANLFAMDMDESDGPTELTWTLTTAPMYGQLELRPIGGGSVMAITQDMTFTQVQLAAGEVFYVHDGGELSTDSFTVQVMDDDGEMADPVTLTVTVTAMDDTPTGVALTRTVNSLDENADTSDRTKVADIMVTDADSSSLADLELAGTHMDLFELGTDSITGNLELFLIAGANLDHEMTSSLEVTVQVVRDTSVSATLSFPVNDVNEAPTTSGDFAFTVVEGASYTLMTTDLSATDEDRSDDPTDLTWTLTTAPMNGQLELRPIGGGSVMPITEGMTFTQPQLVAGEVVYVHDGGEIDMDSFRVQVMDDDGEMAAPVMLTVTVTSVNDAPTASSDGAIEVAEGASYRLNTEDLSATDVDDGPTELTWTLMTAPMNGRLELMSNRGTPINAFTQADVDNDRVFYVHDGEETDTDSFTLQVMDNEGTPAAATVTLTVNVMPVNDAPTTDGDLVFEVAVGASYRLMTTDLSATDEDESDGPAELTWTVMTNPGSGRLAFLDTSEDAMSFTQADVDAGRVVYIHTGADTTPDSFMVRVMDDDGELAAPVTLTVAVVNTPTNMLPTAVMLTNPVTTLREDADTSNPMRVANIMLDDPDGGDLLELTGDDAGLFEFNEDQTQLLLRAGAALDFETNPFLDVTVRAVRNPAGVNAALRIPVSDQNDAPTTFGDGAFTVDEGASYMLTTDDLSATDEDMSDGPNELIWTLTDAPDNGRLELRPVSGPIMTIAMDGTFTQAQLAAGRVFYVHNDSNTPSDLFTVQVMDDGGATAAPVMLNVDITRVFDRIDLADPTLEEGFIIHSVTPNQLATGFRGEGVSGAGDVNGDGYADLIIGVPYGTSGGAVSGEAYVVFGKANGFENIDLSRLDEEDGFMIQGDTESDRAGASVSGVGDVNGDGYADLIVGATGVEVGGSDFAGAAYVVFGKADGFENIDLTSLGAEDGFIIWGDSAPDRAGFSVSGAGDVNGDGFADLIVGARNGNDGGADAGEAYVVFGRADGFGVDTTTVSSEGSHTRRVIDLTSLSETEGFIIQGDRPYDFAGASVSDAGDVNGDGYADLIVGASQGDDRGADAGEAYVVFGKASGFGMDVTTSIRGEDPHTRRVIDLTTLSETDGFILRGGTIGDETGYSVSGAGDINGDGYADLIVGAHQADFNVIGSEPKSDAGRAYVVFGKADSFGSLGGDGRRAINLNSLDGTDGFILQSDMTGNEAGFSVSGAGDVNGDGYADLLVGAPVGSTGRPSSGEAYVVFGKASGFGQISLNGALSEELGFIIRGGMNDDRVGMSVSAAGDINGDGYADLLVGAPQADVDIPGSDPANDAGEAYVVFGGPAGLSTEAVAVLGTNSGDGDLNDDGTATVVLAGAGDDVLNIDGFGPADLLKFDGGSGTDTLRFNGVDLDLNLSVLADTRLSSIERIDLSGSGGNSLSLTRLDLLNLSEVRTEGRAELRVDGNTDDSVTAPDDGWARGADVMIEGTMYRTFDNGNARLLINMDVSLGGNLMATSLATVAEALQNCCVTQTVDIRTLLQALPPEDEEQQRKRMEDELAMLGPLPAARAALEAEQPAAVAESATDLFDLPILNPDDGM